MDYLGDGNRGDNEVPRVRFSQLEELSRRRPERLAVFQRLVPLRQSASQQQQPQPPQIPQTRTQHGFGNKHKSPSPQGFPIYEYSDTSQSSTPSPTPESSPKKAQSQLDEAQTANPTNRDLSANSNTMDFNSSPSGFSPKSPNWAPGSDQARLAGSSTENTIVHHVDSPNIPSTLPFPLISLSEAQRRMRESRKNDTNTADLSQATASTSVDTTTTTTTKPLPIVPRPETPPSIRNLAETIAADFPSLAAKMRNIELQMASLRQQREDIKQLLKMPSPTIRTAALKSLDRKARADEDKKILSVVRVKAVVSVMPTVQADLKMTMPQSPSSMKSEGYVYTEVDKEKLRAAALKDEEEWKELEREIEERQEKLRRATAMLERMKLHFPGAAEMIGEELEEETEVELEKEMV
ncbi:hypothetical protein B0T14DRAFT_570522 [Immersiella caudata]|uniref:Uncharacterized protein n=1 Tax=Immersiella caudata TaxID=314043 RepID=A0AA40BUX8_9PEZI|nr:hypothetical protein B0T14DRAFT_570522 [Immersiella caudata]